MPHQGPRRAMFAALVSLMITSLACSLNTGGTPQSIPTAAAPNQPASTLPPVARVTPAGTAQPTATPVPPTDTPLSGTGPGGCVLKEEYVADVTIPDYTVLAPGASFVKTWRVKNSGTCTWDATYQMVFSDGDQMSGPAGVNINATAPNDSVEVSVNLTAPTTPGTYTGRWRVKASNGVIFGGVTVVIVVPATPTPTVVPMITPTVGAGIWDGHWETNCATFGCGAMELVQKGGVVTGTFGLSGTINATAIGNRLTGTWSNGGAAGSIDWWMGSTNVRWRGNYDAVNAWCGHRTGEVDPAPCGVGTFADDWNVLCSGCDGPMKIDQDGRNFTGTYVNGTLEGTIDGGTATGTWRKTSDGSTGTFTWYLISGHQFNGNYGGTNPWCGYRSGSGAPSQCLKP